VTIVGRAPDVAATNAASPSHAATIVNLLTITLVGTALPLLSFALIGWFSRYAADDYCTAAQVAVAGFAQAQSNLYVNWSGRFTSTLFNTLLEVPGISVVPLLAVAALLAWVGTASWTFRQLAGVFGWRLSILSSTVLAVLLVYATLRTTADLPQDVYWQTGLVTYLLPLILATLFLGWLARYGLTHSAKPVGWPLALGVCFGLAVLAGGSSETFAAAQVAALGLASALALLARSRARGMLLAGLLGAVLALVVVALAPGNEVRQASAARTPLAVAIWQTLDFTRGWLRLTFARPHVFELALLIGIPAVLGAISPRTSSATDARRAAGVSGSPPASGAPSAIVAGDSASASGAPSAIVAGDSAFASGAPSAIVAGDSASASGAPSAIVAGDSASASGAPSAIVAGGSSSASGARPVTHLVGILVGLGLVILACMLPAFYALDSNPPGRAQLIPEYVLLFGVGIVAWCVGASLAEQIKRLLQNPVALGATAALLLALLVLGPLRTARDTLDGLPAARAYAASWDQLDQQVRADRLRGVESVSVPPLPPSGSVQNLDFLGPDRTDWFNQCVAGYYGVNSIAASPGG
jgi:hypothetical protein